MFRKKDKADISVIVNVEEDDLFSKSVSNITNYKDLYSQLIFFHNKLGPFVIEKITSNELLITTVPSLQNDEQDEKVKGVKRLMEDMADNIDNYIKGKAIKMKAHAVFSDGELTQVYKDIVMARFEKRRLEREGNESVEIREIDIK